MESLLNDPASTASPVPSATTRDQYVELAARGGFPLALPRTEPARARWFDDYLALCLERDLMEEGPCATACCACATACAAGLADGSGSQHVERWSSGGLAASTASDYGDCSRPDFWCGCCLLGGRTLRSAAGSRPKLHMVDSGLAARLLRLPPDKLSALDPAALQQFGHLLETFVVGEIVKQASWMDHRPHIGHWRTHDGAEVDLVMENGRDGSVVGVEVKSGSRTYPKDRRGLRMLRDTLGDRFTAGVVLYTGRHSIRYQDADAGIIALPIDRLWT